MILNTPPLPTSLTLFEYAQLLTYQSLSCNKTLNMLGMSVLCINRISLHKMFTQNVLNLLMKVVQVFVSSSQKYYSEVYTIES